MGEIRDDDEPIEVLYHDEDDTWNIIEEKCWYWEREDGDEFVDALCALVMERARRRAVLATTSSSPPRRR
jgi:hypothetical protein